MACPNIKSKEWKALVAKIGFVRAFEEFRKHGDLIPPAENYKETIKGVDASTKMARALLHPKAQSLFKAFFHSNPDKFYGELMQNAGATKQQVDLLKGLNEKTQPATLVDMVSNLMAETSYVIKIEEALDAIRTNAGDGSAIYEYHSESTGLNYTWNEFLGYVASNNDTVDILPEDAERINEMDNFEPTSDYANLTVPGGVNYRENRIITPGIIPIVKGHAAFAGREDIGWFRSDDKGMEVAELTHDWDSPAAKALFTDDEITEEKTKISDYNSNPGPKTRRILEVQSDLFQKNREATYLVDVDDMKPITFETEFAKYTIDRTFVDIVHENGYKEHVTSKEIGGRSDEDLIRGLIAKHKAESGYRKGEDQFLKLLRDDNNWVSFFIQAIVQDSVRRGYEKIWFPSGDTVAKIEGHQTLEEYIKTREERLKVIDHEIKEANSYILSLRDPNIRITKDQYGDWYAEPATGDRWKMSGESKQHLLNAIEATIEGSELDIHRLEIEGTQFQNELDDARNGRANLSAIHSFYENDVQNILRKRGFNPQPVTDEHGNTWFEVTVKQDFADTIFFNRRIDHTSLQFLLDKGLAEQVGEKIKIKKGQGNYISDAVAVINAYNNKYYEKHGIKPFVLIHEADGSWTVELQAQHERVNTTDLRGQQHMATVLAGLQARFGMQSKFISSKEAEELLGDRYNGEGAFFHNGTIYFIEGRVGLEDALHEYSHPLVMGIRNANPTAYNNLYSELQNSLDPNVLHIFATVRRLYPEYAEDSNEFKDEVMVRAITANAQDKLNQSSFKQFLQRLWYRIKELLRSLFGDEKDLSRLSAKTTIKQLADMLSFGTSELAIIQDRHEYSLFNRDMAKELESIPTTMVMRNIEMFQAVIQKHLTKLQDDRNYGELKAILKNESDGSILSDMNSMLRAVKDLQGSIEQNFTKLRAFANSIIAARMISEKMKQHIFEMRSADLNEQEELRILTYYNTIVDEWQDTFDELRKSNIQDFPLLRKEIMEALDNIKTIKDYTMEVYERGVVELLVKELKPLKEEADREYIERLKLLAEEADKGNHHAAAMHAKLASEYERFNYDEEFVRSMLRGEKGDTNAFSGFLMSYTSSPDPIIGGFATFMKKNFMKVESIIQEMSTRFRNELKDSYKLLGVNRANPAGLGEKLVSVDKIPGRDESGNLYAHDVYVLMNEFHNGWLYDYRAAENKRDAAKESGDKAAYDKALLEFETLKEQYFHREYLDQVYEARKFWERNDVTRAARDKRKEITDELRQLEMLQDQGQDYDADDMDRIEDLHTQLRQLRSLKNPDGTDKVAGSPDPFQNLEIAQALQEYSNLTKDFYQEYEIKGAFKRAYDNFAEGLVDKGIQKDTPAFTTAISAWVRNNVRFRLSEQFYDERQKIIDEIGNILAKLGPKTAADMDISSRWKKIFDIIRGLRDQDGQPIGTDINEAKINEVRYLQLEIEQIKTQVRSLSGLTQEEQEEVDNYLDMITGGFNPTQEQYERYTQLINKSEEMGLSAVEKGYLFAMFNVLKEFQTKIPTEYYIEAMNAQLQKHGVPYSVNVETAGSFLDYNAMAPILQQYPEFAEWYHRNHLNKGETWNPVTKQYDLKFERLYVWNRIVPNDPRIIDALNRGDYNDLYNIKSPYFEAKHASKYYFYRIKDEFRTKREVGVTTDNRGNWLPKLNAASRKYINEDYLRLRDSADPKDKALFKILETMKKYHIGVQKNAPKYTRLWMEIPRRRKETIENVVNTIADPLQAAKNIGYNVKTAFATGADEFDRGLLKPKDIKNESKMYVMTDLFGNEIQSIPVRYMSKLDKDQVSLDLFASIMLYAAGVENNKMLHDINPVARALEKTLAENGIQAINKVSTTAWLSKHFNISVKSHENNRLQILRNMLERDIEGIQNKMELTVFGHKVANHLMGLAAFGSLALNIPGGIKNLAVARIQNLIESITGKHFTAKDWGKATGEFLNRIMPKLIKDYNAFAGKSLETQMWEIFDPVEGKFGENIGGEGAASLSRDFVTLRWSTSPQKFGEINAQGTSWMAMMKHQKVPMTINGETTMITYDRAWELKDGVIQLRPGIPEEWGRTGDAFLAFKAKVHKVNELLQGAYAKLNQPEAQRYTTMKLVLFMRKYFAPGFVNRFAFKNPSVPLGQFREGYYITWVKTLKAQMQALFLRNKKNWSLYSQQEKRAAMKVWAEMGYSLAFFLLLTMLGYGGDGDDKHKRVQQMSWAHQMAIYELLMIKSEAETFAPFPGMGINELLRMKDNPSIAFPLVNRYYKVLVHGFDLIIGDKDARYERKTGIWEKGDVKLWADLLKIGGINGNTFNPDIAIKNYSMTMNRYN